MGDRQGGRCARPDGDRRTMTLRIVRLGEPRHAQEGTRIGTVRRPPRGVRKERHAPDDWFDVWYPDLAPSARLMAQAKAAVTNSVEVLRRDLKRRWMRRWRRESSILWRRFAWRQHMIGCYCENEAAATGLFLRTLDGPRRKPRVAAAAMADPGCCRSRFRTTRRSAGHLYPLAGQHPS